MDFSAHLLSGSLYDTTKKYPHSVCSSAEDLRYLRESVALSARAHLERVQVSSPRVIRSTQSSTQRKWDLLQSVQGRKITENNAKDIVVIEGPKHNTNPSRGQNADMALRGPRGNVGL